LSDLIGRPLVAGVGNDVGNFTNGTANAAETYARKTRALVNIFKISKR